MKALMITALANPKRFLDLSRVLAPWTCVVAAVLLGIGFYWSLFATPPDYQQGQSVKIMFVHVPAAWMGIFIYSVMAGASLVGLVFRHPLADVAAKSAAPLGAAFTALALLTGSLWGRPMWGTYWQWGDARLVSELILLFIYLGYIALWNAIDDPVRAAKAAAILSLVGAADVPVIHFSVDWWNTLHQPASILRLGGPTIDKSFLAPLLIMIVGYTFLFLWLWLLRMQTEILERRARSLMMARGA
jgi:heme exporter protein C